MFIQPRFTLPSHGNLEQVAQEQKVRSGEWEGPDDLKDLLDKPTERMYAVNPQVVQTSHRHRFPKRILGFSLVGGGVMLGGILFLFILVQFLHVEKHFAYLLQAIVSIETNFLLNRFTNWKDRGGNFFVQWIKFHSTSAFTFPLNQGLFALLTLLGLPYILITIIGAGVAAIVNYFANDRFVFKTQKKSSSLLDGRDSSMNLQLAFPHVGVIIPMRNAQRTIRQCISSILSQDYKGQISIFLVGNVPEQDTTWDVLEDFLQDPRIHAVQIQRPSLWTGRDANMKRYCGCETAIASEVDVIAFTDAQVIAPVTWITSAITLLKERAVGGVAGRSYRQQGDSSMPSIYQDSSFFSEWPRYKEGFLLSASNFHNAKGLPVTNNLIITRQAWIQVRTHFPLKTTYSWEDFRFAWELTRIGCVLYCTDAVYVYRNHRSRFRLAKQIAAGAGAFTFYQEKPDCVYVKRMLWKASVLTIVALAFSFMLCIALLSMNTLLLLFLSGSCAFTLLISGILSMIKARDIRGTLFPFLDILHIGLWIVGAITASWDKEENNLLFAELLVQLR